MGNCLWKVDYEQNSSRRICRAYIDWLRLNGNEGLRWKADRRNIHNLRSAGKRVRVS